MLKEGEFAYRGAELACEGVDFSRIAELHGTPAYVYSKRALVGRFHAYKDALTGIPHRVCYAVKANSNLAVLGTLAREGAWFDIVSEGELFRVLAAGGDPKSIVFSGVGKAEEAIQYALQVGIHSFNCESETEINLISRVAVSLGRKASIALRVNPDVDAMTHPYISTGLREHKFGVDISAAEAIYDGAMHRPGLMVEGVSCHIGSQVLDVGPLLEAAEKMLQLLIRLRARGIPIRYLDLGGGLGVSYQANEAAVSPQAFVKSLRAKLSSLDLTIMLEPGRSVVAEAGVLLTRVLLTKQNGRKQFVIVDAGMNDLLRPALYQAHHEIIPVTKPTQAEEIQADIVGPVCETGDFLARARRIPAISPGDLLAVLTAGAYGFVLSSNYNSRPRACELLVDGDQVHVARQRETLDELIRGEATL